MNILSVDPGKNTCGVALFHGAQLVACGYPAPEVEDPFHTAVAVQDWLLANNRNTTLEACVVEAQQIYHGPFKSNPNDLLPLAYVSGAVHARVPAKLRVWVKPKVWTNSQPKAVREPKVLSALTPEERAIFDRVKLPKDKKHNVLDAVAIGLFYLDRLSFDKGVSRKAMVH